MRRILFYSFFDADGIVDDHVLHKLRALREHTSRIVVIAREPLGPEGRVALAEVADDLIVARDAASIPDTHRIALAEVGEELFDHDELLLLDSGFFGPVFPFAEVFDRMADSPVDFWGMTSHRVAADGAEHLHPHWLVVRRSLFTSPAWTEYWRRNQDSSFTAAFDESGFTWQAAFPQSAYPTDDPSFESAHLLLRDRCPVLTRRIFLEEPSRLDRAAVLGRRMLTELEGTNYPLDLLWPGIAREAEPRKVLTNLSLLEVLPDVDEGWRPETPPRIAVCVHVYYDDMIPELMGYIGNIPVPYHLDITTDTEAKRDSILRLLEPHRLEDVTVRVLESNQGRDTSAFLIGQRDLLLSDDYDLICRLHSKKSPQDDHNVSDLFRHHLYENLLPSRGYVAEVLRLFDEHSTLGMVFPPVINIGYPTLGHAWFANREPAQALAARLGIRTRFDSDTPVAPYGSMFWARPRALRKLVEPDWQWTDFPQDGEYRDGALTHVLERLLAYAVLDAGFHVRSVINRDWASINYAFLEYKLQRVSALMPAFSDDQVNHLLAPPSAPPLLAAVKQRISQRFPAVARGVAPGYKVARAAYRRTRQR